MPRLPDVPAAWLVAALEATGRKSLVKRRTIAKRMRVGATTFGRWARGEESLRPEMWRRCLVELGLPEGWRPPAPTK